MENNIKGIKEIRIDTTNWKKYNLIDLFEIKRGQRLRSLDRKKGNIRYFSATSENNGVSCYISNPLFTEENALIFNTFGNIFYCDEIFSGSDEITILKNKNINKNIGIYLSSIMSKEFENKFGYSNKAFFHEIIKETIKLPSILNKETNEFEPDWKYMEDYIINLEKDLNIEKINNTIDNIKNIKKEEIDISNLKEYNIIDLFEIKKGVRLNKSNRKEGEIPFLTSTSENNGVSNYIDKDIIKMDLKNNAITIDMFHNVFYHNYYFLCDDNVHILKLKEKEMNKELSQFISTILKHNKKKYHYGQQVRLKHLEKETIKLPSKLNKETNKYEPDWKYMEDYISNLEKELNI